MGWENNIHFFNLVTCFTNLVVHKRNNWIQFSNNKSTTPDKRHTTYNQNSLYICVYVCNYVCTHRISKTLAIYIRHDKITWNGTKNFVYLTVTCTQHCSLVRLQNPGHTSLGMLALQDNLHCPAIVFALLRMAGIISHLVAMARELKSDRHSFTSRITRISVLPTVSETLQVNLNKHTSKF